MHQNAIHQIYTARIFTCNNVNISLDGAVILHSKSPSNKPKAYRRRSIKYSRAALNVTFHPSGLASEWQE